MVNLHFINIPGGRYAAQLYSPSGDLLLSSFIGHEGNAASATIVLPASIHAGAYNLKIVIPGKTDQVQSLIIQ